MSYEEQNESMRLKEDYSDKHFAKKLRECREAFSMTRKELGEIIGRQTFQIGRYEDEDQLPPLNIFVKICVALQIESNELLNLKKVSIRDEPEAGFIYGWEMKLYDVNKFDIKSKKEIKLLWKCSLCDGANIEYDFKAVNENYRCVKVFIKCEHCHSVFDSLQKNGQKIYKGVFK